MCKPCLPRWGRKALRLLVLAASESRILLEWKGLGKLSRKDLTSDMCASFVRAKLERAGAELTMIAAFSSTAL